ncbi:MAG: hypothetical protein IJP11_09185 [Oscillospiraceae bacterium]|nr:hypothetical protein [Oscillospiraceae bacterium]
MEGTNYPVEMISVCNAEGNLTPIRFRYELEDQSVRTVQIAEVISMRNISHVGSETMVFLCRASMEGESCLVELKYSIRTHRWKMFRTIC